MGSEMCIRDRATLACSGVVIDHNTSSLNTSTKPEKVSVNAELMKVRDC